MAMAWVWTLMVTFSIIYGLISGNINSVSAAALDGASEAVKLSIGICGVTCLWSGIMDVMTRSGLAGSLSKVFHPILRRLLPEAAKSKKTIEAVSANVSANLLGLGNAATPFGIKATGYMAERIHDGIATNDLCMFIVINTASIQLIPVTIAGVRSAAGAAAPFDILPAVWVTSIISVAVGIFAASILKHIWRK